MSAPVAPGAAVRRLLAEALERDPATLAGLPDEAPLFGPALNLDSFSGMTLLAAIARTYGLDLAADDLGLESLETIGTLTAYLTARARPAPCP